MIKKVHVKTGDNVYILSGKDKKKKGKVLKVFLDKGMVLVEGINMATKHRKAKGPKQPSGIIHQELPIYSSKVALICNKCDQPTRIGKKILENGEKFRTCKKCDEIIDEVKKDK